VSFADSFCSGGESSSGSGTVGPNTFDLNTEVYTSVLPDKRCSIGFGALRYGICYDDPVRVKKFRGEPLRNPVHEVPVEFFEEL
jgi:hypothetical protein